MHNRPVVGDVKKTCIQTEHVICMRMMSIFHCLHRNVNTHISQNAVLSIDRTSIYPTFGLYTSRCEIHLWRRFQKRLILFVFSVHQSSPKMQCKQRATTKVFHFQLININSLKKKTLVNIHFHYLYCVIGSMRRDCS